MSQAFQKRVEDFVCRNCGADVSGDGYTNHCPECLWSRHVDVYPGDRKAECGGMMRPVGVELLHGEYVITHRCVACGHVRGNKASALDNFDELLAL